MNKKISIVLGLVVLLGIAWFLQTYYKPSPNQQKSSDSMSDWKTYTNSKHAFEIKYPNDYDLLESVDQGADVVTIHPKVVKDNVGILIVIIPNTTVEDFAAKVISNAKAGNIENLEIREAQFSDGRTAVKTVSGRYGANSPTVINTLLQKDNNVFEFSFLESSSDSVESKIFHSFKFTR